MDVLLCCVVCAFDAGLGLDDWSSSCGLGDPFGRGSVGDGLRARVGGFRHGVGCASGGGGDDSSGCGLSINRLSADNLSWAVGRDRCGQSGQTENQGLPKHFWRGLLDAQGELMCDERGWRGFKERESRFYMSRSVDDRTSSSYS